MLLRATSEQAALALLSSVVKKKRLLRWSDSHDTVLNITRQ